MSKIDLRLESVNADRRMMKIIVQYDAIGLSPGSEGIYLATSGNTSGHFTAEDAKALRDALIERYPLETPVAADIEELKARIARLEGTAEEQEPADFCPCGCDRLGDTVNFYTVESAPVPLFRKGERVRLLDGSDFAARPGAIAYVAEDHFDGDKYLNVRWDETDPRIKSADGRYTQMHGHYYPSDFGADDTLQVGDRVMVTFDPTSDWNGPGTITEINSYVIVRPDSGVFSNQTGAFALSEVSPLLPGA